MNFFAHLLLSIASLIGGAHHAPAPAEACKILAGSVDADPEGIERLIEAEGTGRFDYVGGNPGEWVAEGGDGRIVGYSLEEDSTVWNSAGCALSHGAY